MAQPPRARPVPRKRKDVLRTCSSTAKAELVNSFAGFNATTVSEKHMQLAKKCIEEIPYRSARFEHVPFHMILQWNQDKPNYQSMIAQACDLLLKYVINLLKPKRPQVWRSIKTTNSHFCARVDCMVGARDILAHIGYSENQSDSAIQFPDSVKEPNKQKLHVIAAELLMAKLEAEELLNNPMTRQSSNPGSENSPSSTSSIPGSQHQSLSPRLSYRSSHDTHMIPVTSYSGDVTHNVGVAQGPHPSELPVSQGLPQGTAASHGITPYSGGSEYTPGQQQFPTNSPADTQYPGTDSSQLHNVQPTAAKPIKVSQYETPIPQASVSKTPPSTDDHSSLGSSEEYETPPSTSPQPLHTAESKPADSMPAASSLMDELKQLKARRENIKDQIHNPKPSSIQVVPTLPQNQANTRKTQTSVQTVAPSFEKDPTALGPVKRPPKKKHPHFMPESIMEEAPSSIGNGVGTSATVTAPPPAPGSATSSACSHCGNLVSPNETHCGYCKTDVSYRHPTSSILPPPIHSETSLMKMSSEEPKEKKPLRASAADAEEAIQQHRRTQAFPAAMHGSPGGVGSGEGGRQEGGRGSGAVAGGHVGTEGGGASGGALESNEKSYKEILEEKSRVWKEAWRQRGYSDGEIPQEPGSQPLPEPKAKKPAQAKAKREKKHYVASKSTTDELHRYQMEEDRKKVMKQMADEGEALMNCIKLCVQHGYSLEEVALAFRRCQRDRQTEGVKNPRRGDKQKEVLRFLQQDWRGSVREVQQYVLSMVDQQGQSVGCPSELEARKHLVFSNGDVIIASHKLYAFRKKKIEELQCKFRPYGELEWKAAELALSAFDMNVDKAACSIQCESLQPLYEFIFSEWTQVPATDMKNIKERLKRDKDGPAKEANMRMLMGEYRLESTEKAAMVMELMNMVEVDESLDYPLSYYIDAAKDYSTLKDAERGLIKDCPICVLSYPVHEMIIMPGCTDTMCKDCFKGHFKVVITEKGVKHFNCPSCDKPDMTNRDESQDLYQELFVHLIHEHLPEHYNLVQDKLTERNLQKDPGFCWCASEGCVGCFINPDLQRKKIQCPSCSNLMCFQCKKPWEDQHNGLSCEQFAAWKRQNDPKFQKEGLAAHLQANGIECPDCHMRYELARGGCMHFKCTRCPNEFCSGCGGSFKKAQACGRFQSCANRGLHAHHPRDCLYFMRDFTVEELQGFLRENNVNFETDPAPEQVEAAGKEEEEEGEGADGEEGEDEAPANAGDGKKVVLKCSAMLQKEIVDKLVDEACGDVVKDGHAGLCEKHYKEYLVDRINNAKLDPLPMYDKIELLLTREEKQVPEKEVDESDEDYRQRLIEYVKQELPLQRGQPQEQLPAEDQQQVPLQDIED